MNHVIMKSFIKAISYGHYSKIILPRARSWGNAVRSEAELAEIVEQLTEHQESEDKHLECAATTPHMILSSVEKARRFYNENGSFWNLRKL